MYWLQTYINTYIHLSLSVTVYNFSKEKAGYSLEDQYCSSHIVLRITGTVLKVVFVVMCSAAYCDILYFSLPLNLL